MLLLPSVDLLIIASVQYGSMLDPVAFPGLPDMVLFLMCCFSFLSFFYQIRRKVFMCSVLSPFWIYS